MSDRGRSIAGWTLVVLACIAIMLALVVGYVRRAAVDSDQFANRATVALKSDSVRSLIAARVTDQLVLERQPTCSRRARSLARAHARTGDRVAIAAYLGASDTFDQAILAFSQAYAEQNERDYAALQSAAKSGRVVAESGI